MTFVLCARLRTESFFGMLDFSKDDLSRSEYEKVLEIEVEGKTLGLACSAGCH